mgnify:CR=1 FL=1
MDRIIIIDSDANLSEIDLNGLVKFKSKLHGDSPSGRLPEKPIPLRAAIVCSNSINATISSLYASIMQGDPAFEAVFEHFSTLDTALDWLGKSHVRVSIDD